MKRKLQIFISSTFSDLIEERQAAVAAVLKAGHIPAGMELFTAGDISQMETIKRWIEESDAFMLILGGRYGSIEPTTNVSYTELEYDYALEQGKPSFAVVIEDVALEARIKSGGKKFVESENPESLAQFRSKVLRNISSFFSDPKDIKLCVYESLADLSDKPTLKGWMSAADVPDVRSLNSEIESLRRENAALAAELKKATTEISSKGSANKLSDEELEEVLKAIDIKVPANLSDGTGEATKNLFSIAMHYFNTLTNGVYNRADSTDFSRFIYWNVFPKLQAHGLASNEHVPGVRYRRSFLNERGRSFFAEIERKRLLTEAAVRKKSTTIVKPKLTNRKKS